MDRNKLIIIGLVIVIVALGVVAASMMFNNSSSQSTIVKIMGKGSFEQGDKLTVKLSDSNGTGLEDEKLHIVVIDKKGKEVFKKSVLTNSKGKAHVDLDLSKGKYKVNVTFDGNDNYTGNSTQKSIKIKEKIVKTELVSSESQSEVSSTEPSYSEPSSSEEDPYGGMYEEYEDEHGDTVHQFNWGDGSVEKDYDDGYYEITNPDGSVDTGYWPS